MNFGLQGDVKKIRQMFAHGDDVDKFLYISNNTFSIIKFVMKLGMKLEYRFYDFYHPIDKVFTLEMIKFFIQSGYDELIHDYFRPAF